MKNLQDFNKIITALIKNIFLRLGTRSIQDSGVRGGHGNMKRESSMAGSIAHRTVDDNGGNEAKSPLGESGASSLQRWGQAVDIFLRDDRLRDRGAVELEVRHGQGAIYQYNVQVPNIMVTNAATDGMEVRVWLTREVEGMQVHSIRHRDGQLVILLKSKPTLSKPLHGSLRNQP